MITEEDNHAAPTLYDISRKNVACILCVARELTRNMKQRNGKRLGDEKWMFSVIVACCLVFQVDNVKCPTWECLIAALQSPIVKQNATAQQLRQWLISR